MASGSYFTIFRKSKSITLPADKLEALKAEYMKSNDSFFPKEKDKSCNIPLLMQEDFVYSDYSIKDAKSNNYYDKDGVLHEKLLAFDFCSTFTCLKEKCRKKVKERILPGSGRQDRSGIYAFV
jgi:hypothetical protein